MVKIYVPRIKEQKTRLAYARFETEPGLQPQVDWGDFQVQEVDGKTTTLYAFILLLGYSRTMNPADLRKLLSVINNIRDRTPISREGGR